MSHTVLSSVTRIAPLSPGSFAHRPLERQRWRTGDYVVARVTRSRGTLGVIELQNGRDVEVIDGDLVVGALGVRHATLEATGDWRAVGADGDMHALTRAGVLGRCTSISRWMTPLVELAYEGHVLLDGSPCRMLDHSIEGPSRRLAAPVVLLIGTSMDAGKTVSAKAIVRRLKHRGLRVGGAKLTGVGRLSDILAMQDAGADVVLDFVDAGLPSTVCEREVFEAALDRITSAFAREQVDVVVAEAGASPLEPYNGAAAVERLGEAVGCTVLCASDPYAVVGVMSAFGVRPDLVAGRCASTRAGIELVERLAGVPALDLTDPGSRMQLDALLANVVTRPPTSPTRAGRTPGRGGRWARSSTR